jgi:hypothetical protein
MADLSFQPVAAGIKPPQTISIADMLNIANSAQQYQQAQQLNPLNVQQKQLEIQRLQQLTPAEVRRATAEANVSEATSAPRISKAGSEAETAATQATGAAQDLFLKQHQAIASQQIGLMNNPLVIKAEQHPETLTSAEKDQILGLVHRTGQTIGKNIGLPANKISQLNQAYVDIASTEPQNLRSYIKQQHIAGLDAPARTSALTPSGIAVDTGQNVYTSNTNPFAATGEGQVIPGSFAQKQLPPTTPVVQGTTPGYYGAQGNPNNLVGAINDPEKMAILNKELGDAISSGNVSLADSIRRDIARSQSGGKSSFVASGLPAGAEESIKGNVGEMNSHFSGLNAQAAQLARTGALVGNIKSLADKAITGTEQGRKAYVNGLLDSFGLGNKKTEDLQTNTNLLDKYLSDLNLQTPAASDAARQLITAARPNAKMDATAIVDAADLLHAQIKASSAFRNSMQNARFSNNPEIYQNQRTTMEPLFDPRIWQFEGKPAAEQARLMKKLSPADRAAIIANSKKLHDLGVIQ